MRLYSFLECSECVFLLGDARGWAEGQSGFQQTQNQETGKEKYIFFKASINPLKSCTCMFTFFPGSRPALKSSSMKKLDSWEPKEQHEASTTNIHDLWFRELLVNKQARWRREKRTNQISSDRGFARPPGPSVEPGLMWCVKRSLFGGFSLRLKKNAWNGKSPPVWAGKHRLALSAFSLPLSLFPMADLEKSARGGHEYF